MKSELRECTEQLRQIEAYNRSAMERASREIQHDNYRLARALHDAGYQLDWLNRLEDSLIEGS